MNKWMLAMLPLAGCVTVVKDAPKDDTTVTDADADGGLAATGLIVRVLGHFEKLSVVEKRNPAPELIDVDHGCNSTPEAQDIMYTTSQFTIDLRNCAMGQVASRNGASPSSPL